MGFRFRKSFGKGLRLNVGKRGVSSISLGGLNIGTKTDGGMTIPLLEPFEVDMELVKAKRPQRRP